MTRVHFNSLNTSINSAFFSEGQLGLDSLSFAFSRQACDPVNLLAMTAGGLSFRLARVGFLSAFSSLSPILRNPLASALSLGLEVGVFRGVNHTFHASGENYWNLQGFAREYINFGCLKSVGHYLRSSNILLTHVSQNLGMMMGEELGYRLRLTPEIQGSFAERFVHASATNLALGVGTVLAGRLLGGKISSIERSLENVPLAAIRQVRQVGQILMNAEDSARRRTAVAEGAAEIFSPPHVSAEMVRVCTQAAEAGSRQVSGWTILLGLLGIGLASGASALIAGKRETVAESLQRLYRQSPERFSLTLLKNMEKALEAGDSPENFIPLIRELSSLGFPVLDTLRLAKTLVEQLVFRLENEGESETSYERKCLFISVLLEHLSTFAKQDLSGLLWDKQQPILRPGLDMIREILSVNPGAGILTLGMERPLPQELAEHFFQVILELKTVYDSNGENVLGLLRAHLLQHQNPMEQARQADLAAMASELGKILAAPCSQEEKSRVLDTLETMVQLGNLEALNLLIQVFRTDPASSLRRRTILKVRELRTPFLVKPLLEVLGEDPDPYVRREAAETLGELRDPRAVDGLIKALNNDTVRDIQITILIALGKIKDPQAVPVLLKGLHTWNFESAYLAAEILVKRFKVKDIELRNFLREALKSSDPHIQGKDIKLAELLGQSGSEGEEEALNYLEVILLNSTLTFKQQAAVKAVQHIGTSRAWALLTRVFFETREVRVIHEITYALIELKAPEAFDLFVKALEDSDANRCYYAIRGLTSLKDARAVGPLIRALENSKSDEMGDRLVEALELFQDPRIPEALLAAFHRKPSMPLCKALGKLGDPRAILPMLKYLGSLEHYHARYDVKRAMEHLLSPEVLLAATLRRPRD